MKKPTNLKKLLQLLKDGKWHPAMELAQFVSHRFGHTIYEARKKGFCIEKRLIEHNVWVYRWQQL